MDDWLIYRKFSGLNMGLIFSGLKISQVLEKLHLFSLGERFFLYLYLYLYFIEGFL